MQEEGFAVEEGVSGVEGLMDLKREGGEEDDGLDVRAWSVVRVCMVESDRFGVVRVVDRTIGFPSLS